jgi:hypothetical protein
MFFDESEKVRVQHEQRGKLLAANDESGYLHMSHPGFCLSR